MPGRTRSNSNKDSTVNLKKVKFGGSSQFARGSIKADSSYLGETDSSDLEVSGPKITVGLDIVNVERDFVNSDEIPGDYKFYFSSLNKLESERLIELLLKVRSREFTISAVMVS